MWLYELVSLGGVALAELEARDRTLTLVRNDAGQATFSLTLREAAELLPWLAVGEVDLRVSRNGVALFRGPINGAQASPAEVGGSVTFTAVGVWDIFADRYTDAPYSILATEQTTIAWTLIVNSQARPGGDLAITAGALPASRALDVVEWQTPSTVKSAVEGLAAAPNGFDFALTPAGGGWTFDCFYPRQGGDRGLVLERGRNLRAGGDVTFDAGPGRLISDARAIGQGGAYVDAEDTTARARFRRREVVVTVEGSDASSALVMGDRAGAALVRAVRPLPRLELVPGSPDADLDHVGLGDVVEVAESEGWLTLEGAYRVEAIEVRPDAGDPEALALSVSPYP